MRELFNQIRLMIIRIFLSWIIDIAPRGHPESRIVVKGVMNIAGAWSEYLKRGEDQ